MLKLRYVIKLSSLVGRIGTTATITDRLTGHTHACSVYDFSLQMDSMITVCLFVYLGRSVGGHMLVHELLMDRSKLIQKYKSG